MAIHPKDKASNNPRLQCSVCGKWKRLYRHGKDEHGTHQTFYGGCQATENDHLAGDGMDVCHECCKTECSKLAQLKKAA
jgi:uncharacterized protein YcgI (DUF1989 family)